MSSFNKSYRQVPLVLFILCTCILAVPIRKRTINNQHSIDQGSCTERTTTESTEHIAENTAGNPPEKTTERAIKLALIPEDKSLNSEGNIQIQKLSQQISQYEHEIQDLRNEIHARNDHSVDYYGNVYDGAHAKDELENGDEEDDEYDMPVSVSKLNYADRGQNQNAGRYSKAVERNNHHPDEHTPNSNSRRVSYGQETYSEHLYKSSSQPRRDRIDSPTNDFLGPVERNVPSNFKRRKIVPNTFLREGEDISSMIRDFHDRLRDQYSTIKRGRDEDRRNKNKASTFNGLEDNLGYGNYVSTKAHEHHHSQEQRYRNWELGKDQKNNDIDHKYFNGDSNIQEYTHTFIGFPDLRRAFHPSGKRIDSAQMGTFEQNFDDENNGASFRVDSSQEHRLNEVGNFKQRAVTHAKIDDIEKNVRGRFKSREGIPLVADEKETTKINHRKHDLNLERAWESFVSTLERIESEDQNQNG